MKLLGNYLKSNTFLSLLAQSGPFTELHSLHLFLIRIKPPIYTQRSLSLFGCSFVRVFHLLAAVFAFHFTACEPFDVLLLHATVFDACVLQTALLKIFLTWYLGS